MALNAITTIFIVVIIIIVIIVVVVSDNYRSQGMRRVKIVSQLRANLEEKISKNEYAETEIGSMGSASICENMEIVSYGYF